MISTNTVIAMAAPGGAQGNAWAQPLLMIGIVFVFYFFMMRPQQKKAKEQKNFINNIQKGDRIVTIAGIHGVINKVNEDGTLQLEVSPGSYLKIEKSAISTEWSTALNKPTTTTDK